MKLKKIPVHSNLYGWIKCGKYISYPDCYLSKKDEAKALTELTSDCAKTILGKGDLNENFMKVLENYNVFLENENEKTYFESFFTRIGSFAMSLVNSDSIVDSDEKFNLNKRGNILIAVEFALKTFSNPSVIMSDKMINKIDFESVYPSQTQRNNIYKDLCKTLSRNNQKPEEFVIRLMSYYLEAYNIYTFQKIKKGLVPDFNH